MPGPREAESKAVAHAYYEAWNRADMDGVYSHFAQEVLFKTAPPGLVGLEGFKQLSGMIHTAFPDLQFSIEEMIAEDDRIFIFWTARGTHLGEYMAVRPIGKLAPTGKPTNWWGLNIFRIENGKISEVSIRSDQLAVLIQVGAVARAPKPETNAA